MRKNFTFRYALSMSVIVFPIVLIIEGIVVLIQSIAEGFQISFLLWMLLIIAICMTIIMALASFIGYILYKKTNYEIDETSTTISHGGIIARKKDIRMIKARRFIFLYSFDMLCNPWPLFSFLSYYFYSKEELIDFINKNSFLKKYIREKDLIKLGIKE